MNEHVSAGAVVFDIGANVGWHTLRLAKLVGENGAVHSFEPTPRDRELLTVNVDANAIDQVTVHPWALSDQEGPVRFATFQYPGINHIARDCDPDDATVIEAEAIRLDTFVFELGQSPPTFIKIDVEGSEYAVVRGAEKLLDLYKPVVVCEVQRSANWQELHSLFEKHGYEHRELGGDDFLADVLFTPRSGGVPNLA